MSNYHSRRLTRSSRDKKIAGVAGGIADYFDLDPTIVRLAFVAVALLGLGAVVVIYVALWVLLPDGSTADAASAAPGADRSRSNTVLFVIVAALCVLVLASGVAWVSIFSLHLLRIGLPIWLLLIGLVVFMLWSRREKAS